MEKSQKRNYRKDPETEVIKKSFLGENRERIEAEELRVLFNDVLT